MKIAANELGRRKPLWLGLSELFLDTEMQEYTYIHIAKAMKASGYTLQAIEHILMEEVYPVCISNLKSVAGEWAGFQEEWLYENILTLKEPTAISRLLARRNFGLIRNDWNTIVEHYTRLE